jgi:hypothetical protein
MRPVRRLMPTEAFLVFLIALMLVGWLVKARANAHSNDPDDFSDPPAFWLCTSEDDCLPVWDYVLPSGLRCYALSTEVALCVQPEN